MSVLHAACEVSGITAHSRVQGDAPQGWGSLGRRREPVPAGWQEQGCPGGPAVPPGGHSEAL